MDKHYFRNTAHHERLPKKIKSDVVLERSFNNPTVVKRYSTSVIKVTPYMVAACRKTFS